MEGDSYCVNEPSVISEVIDGETIVLNFESGHYYSFNPTASEIWLRVCTGSPVAAATEWVARRFAVDPATIRPEVEDFVAASRGGAADPARCGTEAAAAPADGLEAPSASPSPRSRPPSSRSSPTWRSCSCSIRSTRSATPAGRASPSDLSRRASGTRLGRAPGLQPRRLRRRSHRERARTDAAPGRADRRRRRLHRRFDRRRRELRPALSARPSPGERRHRCGPQSRARRRDRRADRLHRLGRPLGARQARAPGRGAARARRASSSSSDTSSSSSRRTAPRSCADPCRSGPIPCRG